MVEGEKKEMNSSDLTFKISLEITKWPPASNYICLLHPADLADLDREQRDLWRPDGLARPFGLDQESVTDIVTCGVLLKLAGSFTIKRGEIQIWNLQKLSEL
jgi:hypothetical protein